MRRKFSKAENLAVMAVALLAVAAPAHAQDTEQLLDQLRGKTDAPNRSTAQLTEAYQKAIDYLLPRMSADDVESRYDYQIMFQDLGSHAARPGAERERETLAKVVIKNLQEAKMPATVRHWFVLQLERIGKGESVPALAKLMADEGTHLRDYARRALEKNPDPSATEALRKELAGAEDSSWKIGLVNSLGLRKAQAAIEPIAQALESPNPKVAVAAASALGNIGGPESGRALVGVLNQREASALSLQSAHGLIDIAQELARQKNYSDAAQIYQFLYEGATKRVREPDDFNPFSIRTAAINGLAVSAPSKLAGMIGEVMQDDDPKVGAVAVQAARLAPTKEPMEALCGQLADLDPYYQIQVLGLIADRGDLSHVKYAKQALVSSDESVRVAAVEALTAIGTDTGAEALMAVAIHGQGATREAARNGLALMVGPRVEEMIAAQAASGDGDARTMAIGLLGRRRMPGATETLLRYAAEGSEDIRAASFKALADVADLVDVEALAALVVKVENRSVRRSGVAALRAALGKATDKDAAAEILVGQMKASDTEARVTLLTCLDALGGAVAVATVVDAAEASDEALRDAAVRTLSNWRDYEATEALLRIAAKSETSLTHYVLAMRGALRLIGTSESAPLDDRVTLCFYAFDHARRDIEKKLAVATMGSLPSPKVAERLLELARDESVKTEAGMAAVELAGRALRSDRQAAREFAGKVRALNISDEVNRRADAIIRGRRRR
ncbi:MAG: HEAT repeat domain-containing protein [Planctomycetota bacterium]|jgi:HEAT repeat protein